jgi:hypothetical protein
LGGELRRRRRKKLKKKKKKKNQKRINETDERNKSYHYNR